MRRSTRRARISVTSRTQPNTSQRCQSSIRKPLAGVERFPAREAFLEAVPVGDLALADLPAEQHLLAVAQGREVDEPAVEVLDQDAERLQLLDRTRDRLGLPLELLVELARLLRVEVAAVSRDPLGEPRAPGSRDREGAPVGDERLGDRPHLLEQRVRLLRSEVPLRHPSIIARRVRRSTRALAEADGTPR